MFAETYQFVWVVVVRQEWVGLVNRLDTVLPTDDCPDFFEVGNTQAVLDGDLDDFIAASLKQGV